jgi:glycine cleavage system T protein (aminomethyltransferase)
MRRSPLHDAFAGSGAVFEERANHAVAVRTVGLREEAEAIRGNVGIWDHSDMGKIRVKGDGARDLLDRTVSGDIGGLPENSIRYTLVLDEAGKIIADIQVYNNFDEYLVTCGASRKDQVLKALASGNAGDVEIEDVSAKYAAICIEGPKAWKIPGALAGLDIRSLRLLTFTECEVASAKALLARIGYCGEYGYILLAAPEAAAQALNQVRTESPDAVLCGRGVQDLLRLEVRSFNLEKDVPKGESPLEAGLHWMIHFRKPEFPGREALVAEKENGIARKLVAFECADPEAGAWLGKVRDGSDEVGRVVNFDYSPRRGRTIGLAYLDEAYGWPGLDLDAETDSGFAPIRTMSAPFVLTESNRVQIS